MVGEAGQAVTSPRALWGGSLHCDGCGVGGGSRRLARPAARGRCGVGDGSRKRAAGGGHTLRGGPSPSLERGGVMEAYSQNSQ